MTPATIVESCAVMLPRAVDGMLIAMPTLMVGRARMLVTWEARLLAAEVALAAADPAAFSTLETMLLSCEAMLETAATCTVELAVAPARILDSCDVTEPTAAVGRVTPGTVELADMTLRRLDT